MKEVTQTVAEEVGKIVAGSDPVALVSALIGALITAILGGFVIAAYAPNSVEAKIAFATVWVFAACAGLIRARLI